MIITTIKINIPIWNCKKCMVVRKKKLKSYVLRNIDNIATPLILKIIICKDNTAADNFRMISEFKEMLNNILPKKEIKVMICE